MQKKVVALGVLGALLVSSAVYAQNYWTGTGGRGVHLAVLSPTPSGLISADEARLPTMVQGVFLADLSKYSAMSLIDRENLDKVLKESESGIYNDADFVRLGEINVDHVLRGSLTKTSSGFLLQIQITSLKDGQIKASYSGPPCTIDELYNQIAIKKASLALLERMGISLTPQGRAELVEEATPQSQGYQDNMTKARVAWNQGNEADALLYSTLANDFDSTMSEASNLVSVISASIISSGNIGADARARIEARQKWLALLAQTEQSVDTFFKTFKQPYALIYSTKLESGKLDYQTESVPFSFTVDFRESDAGRWTGAVPKTAIAVLDGLNKTSMKSEWGLDNWPRYSAPFNGGSKSFSIVVELLNAENKVIGTQTFNTSGSWSFNFNSGISLTSSASGTQTVTFQRVKANDITDAGMRIRFATVNNIPVADVSKNGVMMITTQADYRDADGFNYDGGGYSWDGFNKEGYDRDGFNRAGYDREGYDREGYGRDGFNRLGYDKAGYDRRDFNKEKYHRNGTRYDNAGYDWDDFDREGYDREGYGRDGFNRLGYDKAGYDRTGFNRDGYDRTGYDKNGYGRDRYNRSGYKRWSPLSSYVELLCFMGSGFSSDKLDMGITVGLLGAYGSFSMITEPTGTHINDEGEEKTDYDTSWGEFVAGYTFNLLTKKNGWRLGLGVPLGIGIGVNMLEIGLQIRFSIPNETGGISLPYELRGTYRTIGFRDNSFTISIGLCWY